MPRCVSRRVEYEMSAEAKLEKELLKTESSLRTRSKEKTHDPDPLRRRLAARVTRVGRKIVGAIRAE